MGQLILELSITLTFKTHEEDRSLVLTCETLTQCPLLVLLLSLLQKSTGKSHPTGACRQRSTRTMTATTLTAEQAISSSMSEFMEMYDVPNGCNSSDGHVAAIRCINGDLGLAMYGDSDITCSLDPEMASTDLFGCQSSADDISDLGAYLQTDCTPTPSSDGSVACTHFSSWSVAAAAAATALATALA